MPKLLIQFRDYLNHHRERSIQATSSNMETGIAALQYRSECIVAAGGFWHTHKTGTREFVFLRNITNILIVPWEG